MSEQIVEGYKAPQDATANSGSAGDTPWVDDLRSQLRKEMIRELVSRRIQEYGKAPVKQPGRLGRIIEGVLVGVATTIVATWVVSRLGGKR